MILPGQNFAPSLSVSQQVVSHVKSVAHTVFPSSTAILFSLNNSSMCHLFLFPIWLFLNNLDKILFLVRAAHSGKVATWWCREAQQSKSVFYKQFLLCCRVIKWLQCLLGLCDDCIDPSPFYYPLESSDQLVCVSQRHWILVRKGALCHCFLGLCPCTAVGAAWGAAQGRIPVTQSTQSVYLLTRECFGACCGWCLCSCAVSLHLGMWSMCSSIICNFTY